MVFQWRASVGGGGSDSVQRTLGPLRIAERSNPDLKEVKRREVVAGFVL
jgi:hypothetical protein